MKSKNSIREERAHQLLEAYRQGDQQAFITLYNMYAEMMVNYGACITSDKELVKDCIQDVFLRLMQRTEHSQQDTILKMTSFLLISLRNRLLDEFRRTNNINDQSVEEAHLLKAVCDVEHDYIVDEKQWVCEHKVSSLMNELTSRQREALKLYYLEERKYEEICQIMDINYASLRNLVHRGIMKMRTAAAV